MVDLGVMASLKLLVLCVSLAVVGVCSVEAEETPSVLVRISHNGFFSFLSFSFLL